MVPATIEGDLRSLQFTSSLLSFLRGTQVEFQLRTTSFASRRNLEFFLVVDNIAPRERRSESKDASEVEGAERRRGR